MRYQVTVELHRDFISVSGNLINVGIKSKPIKDQANKELIKKLSKYFGVSSSSVVIKSGQKSRKKIVDVLN